MDVKYGSQSLSLGTKTDVNLMEFWCFTSNLSSSKCSIRQFNGCLLVPLITVTPKTKTDQDASAWGTEGLVLTDVGSAKCDGFDS